MPLRRLIERLSGRAMLGYAAGLAARGMEAVGKFGLYAAAVRVLGGHDSGLFFICLSWINYASTAARMGVERAMTRHIAAELAVGRGRAARRAAGTGLGAILLASLGVTAITWAGAGVAARAVFRQPDLAHPLAMSAIVLLPQTLCWGIAFVLIGLGRGVASQMVLNALPPVLSLAALAAGARDLDRLFVAYAGSFLVCGLAGLVLLARDWRTRMADAPPPPGLEPEPLPTLWASARPFFAVEMIQNTVLSLPTFVLGAFAPPATVSEFSIATRLSNLVNTVILSISAVSASAFAEHHRRHEYGRLRRVMRQTGLLSLGLSLPVIAVMALVPALPLRLLGSADGDTPLVLTILAAGQLVNCLFPCQDTVLAMIGSGTVLRRQSLVQLAACVTLCLALIPAFGMVGAGIAAAASLAIYVVGCALAVRRVLPRTEDGLAPAGGTT